MDTILSLVKTEVYDKCSLEMSEYEPELESKEYDACRFKIGGKKVISRTAKITPKKVGQFVTFWKRNGDGVIEPFSESEAIDFYSVTVRAEDRLGQFVFPRTILKEKGIISTEGKDGKRGFRVYPGWDKTASAQAARTQNWQLKYFYEIGEMTQFGKVIELYNAT